MDLLMSKPRLLTIVADDYGIGPETSRGILDLAREGIITASVVIVNCADTERAIAEWKKNPPQADLGWHPNLTLDSPISRPGEVPSLVDSDGKFWKLGVFLKRICMGQIKYRDVLHEWTAQYRRFHDLMGHTPPVINSHQHVALFSPVAQALFDILRQHKEKPYLRRVVEYLRPLSLVPGARLKRTFLSVLGRRTAQQASRLGLPGCDQLLGVTDHHCVADQQFWTKWLGAISRRGHVEICCHPGYTDPTLLHRDCDAGDGLLRRPRETDLLRMPHFRQAVQCAGLKVIRPSQLVATFG